MTEKEITEIVGAVMKNLPHGADLSLAQANALIEAVLKRAGEMDVKAVAAVADRHTNPVSVQCMADSFVASYDIAFNKAYTVTALKMPTSDLAELAAPGGSLYGIQFTNNGKIVIFGGGVPLYDPAGNLVGGLGVSGGTEAQDTALAEFGAQWFTDNFR